MPTVHRHPGLGLAALLASSAAFGTSGSFARSLIDAGWSPGAVVLIRIAGAAAVLLPVSVVLLRGRWAGARHEVALTALYGALAVAAAQLGYFQAVARMPVGVALLVEYLGIVLVVLWVWLVRHQPPHRLTVLGSGLAVLGLVLVLDVVGAARPPLDGIAWAALAAVGVAGHYVLGARQTDIPAIAFAGLGLTAGSVVLALLGATSIIEMRTGAASVELAGATTPIWVPFGALVFVAAALAYVLAVVGARHLGSTLASFVGLTEILFAIGFAWLLLDELPAGIQLVGGAVLLGGVVAVQIGERSPRRRQAPVITEPSSPSALESASSSAIS